MSYLVDWTNEQYNVVEEGVLLAKHRLHETGVFSDESLAKMIDEHPDDAMTISTMGTDETKYEWKIGDRNGVSGKVLLETVQRGRLWLNLRNVMDHHPKIKEVVDSIYNDIEANNSGFNTNFRSANLLISSPNALVPYHIDIPVNMLWHIRGEKRVWVYPHFDHRFVSQDIVEQVCAGEYSEDVPYNPAFDDYALVYDVKPGQLLTWPQLTPHRVTNHDTMCVSMSTEHRNTRATRRINVHLANQLLRKFGVNPSADVRGIKPELKQAVSRAVRVYNRAFGTQKEQVDAPYSFKVTPDSPQGFTFIDGDVEETSHNLGEHKLAA